MKASTQHIVSNIKWDLVFNQKQEVNALQNKLSAWSKTQLLMEMESIFNELCPPDQTWVIQSIELDLGAITYQNLMKDLPEKFRTLLYNKLKDSIYRGYLEGKPLNIVENTDSKLQILKTYLEQGYMPWNQFGIISINELFKEQLTENAEMLMLLIRQIGQSETIRKRMAWQLSESSIAALIQEIEPNNHQEINEFVTNFTLIQDKKQIIQSTSAEFRKNLWFWVLNHLFEERGTLFNRVSFMESSIRQMASKMNVSFESLFYEIEAVVFDISNKIVIKGQFVLAMGMIGKAIQKNSNPSKLHNNTPDYYVKELHQLLLKAEQLKGTEEINNLNVLVEQIATRDSKSLLKLINQIGANRKSWVDVFKKLNATAKEAILKVIAANKADFVLQTIRFFKQADLEKTKNSQLKWETESLLFMVNSSTGVFSEEQYINRLISSVPSESNARFIKRIHHQLIAANEISEFTKKMDLENFQIIRNQLLKTVFSDNDNKKSTELGKAIDTLFKALYSDEKSATIFNELATANAVLAYALSREPLLVFKTLKAYAKRANFNKFIQHYFESEQIRTLLAHSALPVAQDMLKIVDQLQDKSTLRLRMTVNAPHLFLEFVLHSLLGNESIQADQLLDKFIYFIRTFEHNSTELSLRKWLELQKTSKNLVESKAKINKKSFQSNVQATNVSGNMGNERSVRTEKPLGEESFQQKSQVLQNNLYKWLKQTSRREKIALMNTCFSNADKLLNHYLISFKPKASTISLSLKLDAEYIFWKCLTAWNDHQGNSRRFEQLIAKNRDLFLLKSHKSLVPINNKMELIANQTIQLKIEPQKKLDLSISSPDFTQRFERLLSEKNKETVDWLSIPHTKNAKRQEIISNSIDFEYFIKHVFLASSGKNRDIYACFKLFKILASLSGSSVLRTNLHNDLWSDAFDIIENKTNHESILHQRIQLIFRSLALEKDVSANEIILLLRKHPLNLPAFIRNYFIAMNPAFASELVVNNQNTNPLAKVAILREIKHQRFTALVKSLILDERIPFWFVQEMDDLGVGEWLEIILFECPEELRKTLNNLNLTDVTLFKLKKQLKFSQWIKGLKYSAPNQASLLSDLYELHQLFDRLKFKTISRENVKNSVFKKMMIAWKNNNWKTIEPKGFWKEMTWELYMKYALDRLDFISDLEQVINEVPQQYKLQLNEIIQAEKRSKIDTVAHQTAIIMKREKIIELPLQKSENKISELISINNAGIVLINSYIKILFDRLGLIEQNQFKSHEDQLKAVHYLQFVVNGLTKNEEHHLVLNKVLCGLSIVEPVHEKIDMTESEKSLINGMITAIINYWPAIGNSSINGFRGNWLIRNGLLSTQEDNWTLRVEKRPYDLLINKSPFSFSIIKHPWMEKPIHVEWAY